jgi:hypothetical protein
VNFASETRKWSAYCFTHTTTKDTVAWNEAKHFYRRGITHVFRTLGKAAPSSSYRKDIRNLLKIGERARLEEDGSARVSERAEVDDVVNDTGDMAHGVALVPLNTRKENSNNCEGGGDLSDDALDVAASSTPIEKQAAENCFVGQETSATTATQVLSPPATYKENVVTRVVMFREKRKDESWIRGRIQECEQVQIKKHSEDGITTTCETVYYHLINCFDKEQTVCRVNLQRLEQTGRLVWTEEVK